VEGVVREFVRRDVIPDGARCDSIVYECAYHSPQLMFGVIVALVAAVQQGAQLGVAMAL
jgi:hypothetical protein